MINNMDLIQNANTNYTDEYDNNFSIHTLTVGQKIKYDEADSITKKLIQFSSTVNSNCYPTHYGRTQYMNFHCLRNTYGINITISTTQIPIPSEHKYVPVHYIEFKINLRKLFGITDYPYTCILPAKLLPETYTKLDSILSLLGINNIILQERMFLKRIDLCTNIKCSSTEEKDALIRIARKGNLPPKTQLLTVYSETSKRKISPKNSFTIKSYCKSYEFSIYDKHSELSSSDFDCPPEELNASENQIRIELRLKNSFINRIKTNHNIQHSIGLISYASTLSNHYITKYINQIYPVGDMFYSYKQAQDIIIDSSHHNVTKDQMLYLLKLTSKKGLNEARIQYNSEYNNYYYIINCFKELNLCPITISNKSIFNELPGFVYYINHHNANDLQ